MLVIYSNDLNELALILHAHVRKESDLSSNEICTRYHGQISTSFTVLGYLREMQFLF